MKRTAWWLTCVGLVLIVGAAPVRAVVFLNEVFSNPPGNLDSTKEYIELLGTPGKKLDGYAIAFINGGKVKVHPATPFPPNCGDLAFYRNYYNDPTLTLEVCLPEIDEFFSLDGLQLGANGMLVLARGPSVSYPTLLSDATFREWDNPPVWNGELDPIGGLENDGSTTVMLVRRRPGRTQANAGSVPLSELRWGKDIRPDQEIFTTVQDPNLPAGVIRWGDGNLDKGLPDNNGGDTLDLLGENTSDELYPDLEIVDEVSWEDAHGWEYDRDDRKVDIGSTVPGLPPRNVHALEDPQGFNPDVITRVDYRTKGPGWAPALNGTGQLENGNNWQDTATEQWIRGESLQCNSGCPGQGAVPQFFYDNAVSANPDNIQGRDTNVPLWLNDGIGVDYNFSGTFTYQIMAGRINPLAIPFIPGDTDRDGDCDADDIAKVAAVFGDDDWVFSNSFEQAPYSDDGDPATQTRPWDVDATGDNGIEASDLQWVLNFQGNTNGRIVGVRYDSTTPTPAGSGVHLNPNTGVTCTMSIQTAVTAPRTPATLKIGDLVTLTVRGRVSSGANTAAGQENGIMQFVQDLALSQAGVLRVLTVTPAAGFQQTRPALAQKQGSNGDLGITTINGYTTLFTRGLTAADDLYQVQLQAFGLGSTVATLSAAAMPRFAASTPAGVKVGRTASQGNPASGVYPGGISFSVISTVRPDLDVDGDVDLDDFQLFELCYSGPSVPFTPGCANRDFDLDGDADQSDFGIYQRCFAGPGQTPPTDCDAITP